MTTPTVAEMLRQREMIVEGQLSKLHSVRFGHVADLDNKLNE